MRILLYSFITQAIVLLGTLRDLLLPWEIKEWDKYWQVRYDRTFYANSFESWQCCDCGMTHLTRPLDGEKARFPAFKMIPVRPHGYNYRLRIGASPSSEFKDEQER